MSSVEAHYGSVTLEDKRSEDGEIDPTMFQQEQYCHMQLGNHYPVPSSILRKVLVKIVLPLLAVWCGLLPILLSIPPANSSIDLVSGRSKSSPLLRTGSSNLHSETQTSLFFEHVLEWFQLPLDEVPTVYDHPGESNHYRASLEFCSDPSTNLFGYGPVGRCVPGKPAPLIRIKPKHFYHLTLYNNAHIETNIHTHGLHVSGVGTVDDVTRVAKPGECLTYEYYILDDADVGTFWYHPHRHPLVGLPAYGGAYGMLIVDETVAVDSGHLQKFYPEHLSNFLTSNEVLLQFSSMYDKWLKDAPRLNRINGRDNLDLFLLPDTYYYFRVSSVVYKEAVNYLEFDPPNACDVRVIAYDGVYRSEIPGPPIVDRHMMTVSSRTDLSVKCSRDVHIHFHQGTNTLESKMVKVHVQNKTVETPSSESYQVSLLESTSPISSPFWDAEEETTWKPRRPYYMPDLSAPSNIVDEYWRVSMDNYFLNGTKGLSVNQHWWDPNKSIRTFDLGQLIEYPIFRSQTHPFHAHINRMQIVEEGGCSERYEEGEYFDTIVQSKNFSTPSGGCTVRTKFFDFAGRIVIHCHQLGHEDLGMMTWIDVLGGHDHGIKAAPATSCDAIL